MENILTLLVANAKSVDGKPLYSNEAIRSAELAVRLGAKVDATDIKRMLKRAEEGRSRQLAHPERQRSEFKIHWLDRQAEIAACCGSFIP